MAVSLQVKTRKPTQKQFASGIYASANISVVVDGAVIVELRDANVRWSTQNNQFFIGPPSRSYQKDNETKWANYWQLLPGADIQVRNAWTATIIQQVQQQIPDLGQQTSITGGGGLQAPQPVQPAQPQVAQPQQPQVAQPQQPAQPAPGGGAPFQPQMPAQQPAQPAQPVAPAPAGPQAPGGPAQPQQPVQPAQPGQPGQPSFPLPGSQPTPVAG